MQTVDRPTEDVAVISSTATTGTLPQTAGVESIASRDGSMRVREVIDRYMAEYSGRDTSRTQRLAWWTLTIGELRLGELSDDEIFFALEKLSKQPARYWAGTDADGRPIYKTKRRPFAAATINRYAAALAAVLTWAIRGRLTPRNWENPCKRIGRRAENNEIVRFLSIAERSALLAACRRSNWPKLYLLVLLALTTGARRGELQRMRWRDFDLDLDPAICTVERTKKDADRRVLPLVPTVVDELRRHVGSGAALVFASGRRPDIAYNYVPSWRKALREAGVRNFRFHDLRHTCASILAQQGATLLEIADVLGHRQLNVTKRYAHLTIGHKARLVNRVLGNIR
jgi:integrase